MHSAVVVGDMQATQWVERLAGRENNPAERARMFRELSALRAHQVLFMGDMVSAPTHKEWRLVDSLLLALREQDVELAAAVGNHDIMFWRTEGLRALRARALVPANATWQRVETPGLCFLVLDTNPRALAGAQLHAQLAWFKAELARAQEAAHVRAVVVVGHHPPMSNARLPHTARATIHAFITLFEQCPKGQLWLSGHVHAYERFERAGRHYVVAGSAGGPRVGLHRGDAMRARASFQLPTPSPFLWLELNLESDHLLVEARGFEHLEAPVQIWDTLKLPLSGR